jgi:hypothetical protein
LSDIRINHTAVTGEGIRKLTTIQGLNNISVAGMTATPITDKSLFDIARCKALSSIDLRENQAITNQGIGALERLGIGMLDLGSTQIDDGAIVHLCKMDRLLKVGLNKTKVTVKGIEQLCRSRTLKEVSVDYCPRISRKEIEKLKIKFPSIAF